MKVLEFKASHIQGDIKNAFDVVCPIHSIKGITRLSAKELRIWTDFGAYYIVSGITFEQIISDLKEYKGQ